MKNFFSLRFLFFILLGCIVPFTLTACNRQPSQSSAPISSKPENSMKEWERQQKEILQKESTRPYKKLLTHTYSEDEIFQEKFHGLSFYNPAHTLSASNQTIYGLNEIMPVELLRRTDEKNAYILYQTSEGGLFYAFFSNNGDVDSDSWIYRYGAYMKKSLSKSNFDSIKTGDSASEVQKVDPITDIYLRYYSKTDALFSYHILKDGILRIRYKRSGDEVTVEKILFREDFLTPPFNYSQKSEDDFPYDEAKSSDTQWLRPYDFRILPQDYIG